MITFIQINFLIVITYVLFFGFQKCSAILNFKSSAISKLRVAQALLILSLLTPLMMKLIPSERHSYANYIQIEEERIDTNLKTIEAKAHYVVNQTATKISEINNVTHFDLGSILLVAWIFGFFLFLSKLCINYFKLKKVFLGSVSLKKNSKIKINISDKIVIPFSARLLNSFWVVLPVSVLNNRTDKNLVIKHEFQHHRQGDTTWAWLIEILTCLLAQHYKEEYCF